MEAKNKKLIGYKLIKFQYEKACVAIVPNTTSFDVTSDGTSISVDSIAEKLLKRVGVLDLWFVPVYEELTLTEMPCPEKE